MTPRPNQLITYRCISRGKEQWGMVATTMTPVEFLESCQSYDNETYFLVNVIEISEEEFKRIAGSLKGM